MTGNVIGGCDHLLLRILLNQHQTPIGNHPDFCAIQTGLII